MADVNIFERATRLKLRIDSASGYLNVEDLWDLSLKHLDTIAVEYHKGLETTTVSFVDDPPKGDDMMQLAFDVVKHVIDVKKTERKAAAEARDKRDQKQKILAIIARKEEGELEGKSLDELRSLVDGL